ncbi:MAG: hypothetical protein IT196_00740 [Acidimicrobiales bacterium]|nr:hypothetical protein [Acidimicrobiales bacterium]
MKLKRRLMKLAAISAATYLFDPTLGAQRRSRLKAKVERFVAQRRSGAGPKQDGPTLTVADRNGHVSPTPDPEAELVVAPG